MPTTHSTAALTLSVATYRQVDYWCRTGALGPDRARRLGSGAVRSWTPRECAALDAIGVVSRDLVTIGANNQGRGGIGAPLVAALWHQFIDLGMDSAVVSVGTVLVATPLYPA